MSVRARSLSVAALALFALAVALLVQVAAGAGGASSRPRPSTQVGIEQVRHVVAEAAPPGPAGTSVVLDAGAAGTVQPPGGRSFRAGTRFVVRGSSWATTSSPDARISAIRISVTGADTRLALQPGGAFAAAPSTFTVAVPLTANRLVDRPGGRVWRADWVWTPPGQPWGPGTGGSYLLDAAAVDVAGRVEAPAQRVHIGIGGPTARGPAFLTVRFGRTTWKQYGDAACTVSLDGASTAPGGTTVTGTTPTLLEVAQAFETRNPRLFGVGNVVVGRTLDGDRACTGRVAHASWQDLATLKADYGWRFNSAGLAYNTLAAPAFDDWSKPVPDNGGGEVGPPAPTMTANVCGSVSALAARGHPEASGMFAYPNDSFSDRLQRDLVSTCFLFGRTYRGLLQVRGIPVVDTAGAAPAAPLWFARTVDVTGGACYWEQPARPTFPNGTGRACTGRPPQPPTIAEWPTCEARTTQATNRARGYPDVGCLQRMVSTVQPGQWLDLQFARFVTGARFGSTPNWDCRSGDWRDHWTSEGELICLSDALTILSTIPASVTIADPTTVAAAWGRTLP